MIWWSAEYFCGVVVYYKRTACALDLNILNIHMYPNTNTYLCTGLPHFVAINTLPSISGLSCPLIRLCVWTFSVADKNFPDTMEVNHLPLPIARAVHDITPKAPFWGWPTSTIDWCEESKLPFDWSMTIDLSRL